MSTAFQKIESVAVTAGKDIAHGIEYPVEFLVKAEKVTDPAEPVENSKTGCRATSWKNG
jgi:hypothetical protein